MGFDVGRAMKAVQGAEKDLSKVEKLRNRVEGFRRALQPYSTESQLQRYLEALRSEGSVSIPKTSAVPATSRSSFPRLGDLPHSLHSPKTAREGVVRVGRKEESLYRDPWVVNLTVMVVGTVLGAVLARPWVWDWIGSGLNALSELFSGFTS